MSLPRSRASLAVRTLGIQPLPISARVARLELAPGQTVTAVARLFAPGQARHCRLCPRDQCQVSPEGHCLVVYTRMVADDEAPLARMEPSAPAPNELRNVFGTCSVQIER